MKKLLLALTIAVSLQMNAQFIENFDAATAPAGWSVINGGDANTWGLVTFSATQPAHSGTKAIAISYSAAAHNDLFITPSVTVTAGVSDNFSFWARSKDPNFPETISLVLSTTTSTAIANFTVVLDPMIAPPSGSNWYQYSYNLSAYVGQNVFIGFKSTTTNKFRFDIDTVVSNALPLCAAPTAGVSNVDLDSLSAELTWVEGGNAFNSNIVVQLASLDTPSNSSGTGIGVAGTTYSAINLTANTLYEFYVRDECAAGALYSTWAGPFPFNTITPPNCNTLTTPANGAINVPLVLVDGTGPSPGNNFDIGTRITTTSGFWTAPTGGAPLSSYNIYLGTSPTTLELLGSLSSGTGVRLSNLLYNTTYYWNAVPKNDGGEASGCAPFSFTTGLAPSCLNNEYIQWPVATYTPAVIDGTTVNTIAADCFTSEFSKVNVVSGQTYEFSSSVATDVINITNDSGSASYVNGIGPKIWTSTLTGVVRFYLHSNSSCDFQTVNRSRLIRAGNSLATASFNNENFAAYPNPVKDVLNISYDKNISSVVVYNLLGQEVLAKSINETQSKIDMSGLTTGTYMVKIMSDNQVKTLKVIKE